MPTPAPTNTAVILERIDGMREDLKSVSESVSCINKNFNDFRAEYIGAHAEVVASDRNAHQRIDKLEAQVSSLVKQVSEIQEMIRPLIYQSKIVGWLAAAIGVSVITFIWAIITHQVTIVVP